MAPYQMATPRIAREWSISNAFTKAWSLEKPESKDFLPALMKESKINLIQLADIDERCSNMLT
jgi:hypothetical protein